MKIKTIQNHHLVKVWCISIVYIEIEHVKFKIISPEKSHRFFFSTHPNFPTAESLIHLVIAIEADRPASSNSFMDLSFNGSRVTFLEAMRSMEFPGSLNRW